MKIVKNIFLLIILQLLIDLLYTRLYPVVNPIRATLIGLTALIILSLPFIRQRTNIHPLIGFLAIYSSALFGALLIQAGILVSKSLLSALAHVAILIITYLIISKLKRI